MKDDTVRVTKRPVRSFRLDREAKTDLWPIFGVIALFVTEWLGLTDRQVNILQWCLFAAALAGWLVPRVWKCVRRRATHIEAEA